MLAPDALRLDGFDFDRVAAAGALDMAIVGHQDAANQVVASADRLVALQAAQPWGQPYAPADGWDWGSNGRILNNLVVLAVAHGLTGQGSYFTAAARGMDYLLGCNALGQSYITGYGTDCTRHQRTRHFAHDLDPSLPPPPPARSPGDRRRRPTRASPPTPAWIAYRPNAGTATSRRRRPPTTCASAGTLPSCSCPPGSRRDAARRRGGQRVPSSYSLSRRRMIFPDAVMGTSSTNCTARGIL